MINLDVKYSYVEDLFDDVCDNNELHLYDFLGGNIVKAFYFALYFPEWIPQLQDFQIRLYSREMRHIEEKISHLSSQIDYWNSVYRSKYDNQEVSIIHYPSYMLDNIIVENDFELLNLSLLLGKELSKVKRKIDKSRRKGNKPDDKKDLEYA